MARGTAEQTPANAAATRRDVAQRILVTIGVVAAYVFLRNVPAPGLDIAVFEEIGASTMVSVVALGVTPVTTGALLVELVGWTVARRDLERRARMRARWMRPAALGLAAIQSAGVVSWLSTSTPTLERPLFVAMAGAPVVVWATFVAGVALVMVGLAAITRSGVGNGFTVCVLCELASSIVDGVRVDGPETLLVLGAMVIVTLAALAFATRLRTTGDAPPTRIPPSGILPLNIAAFAMAQFEAPALVGAVLVAVAALAIGRLWHVARGPGGVGPAHVRGAVFLVATFIAFELMAGQEQGQMFWSASGVLVAVAASVDLVAELRARARLGALTTLVEEQRVDDADALAARLRAAGIAVHLRAVHHRTMLQWLGPYVPVEVMVPAAEQDAARAVLAGLGAYR